MHCNKMTTSVHTDAAQIIKESEGLLLVVHSIHLSHPICSLIFFSFNNTHVNGNYEKKVDSSHLTVHKMGLK